MNVITVQYRYDMKPKYEYGVSSRIMRANKVYKILYFLFFLILYILY